MKAAKFLMFAFSVVFAIIAMQILILRAAADPIAPVPPKASPATQPTSQPSATVKINNFKFDPKELEVAVGTKVTWQNADDVPHTATCKDDPQTFDSGALDTDGKYSFTFTKAGKYNYYCKVHPHMTGVVTVK